MILEKDSSVLGYPGEKSKALDADHHSVCKFDGPQDPNYVAVRNTLQSLVAKITLMNRLDDDPLTIPEKLVSVRSSLGITEMPDTDYISFRDQWFPGTCDWVLDDRSYIKWLDPSESKSSLLWLTGGAASGKSVLSSFIINHIVERGLSCQYFFIRFGDKQKKTSASLLRSIAYQVASNKPKLVDKILQLRQQGVDLETANARTVWERVFKAILFSFESQGPYFWVIDGLDEADDPRAIVKLFSGLSESLNSIRVLFTSRETPEIAATIRKAPKDLNLKHVHIEEHKEDLACYIEQELALLGDSDFREHTLRKIVNESQNNFLVSRIDDVDYLKNQLIDQWVRIAVETLNICHSKEDVELALHQLPIGMHAFYARMATSITQKKDVVQRKLATAVLESMTAALQILTVAELAQALQQEAFGILDFQRSILDVCCGFVVVNKDGYVALVHQTAREYLLHGHDHPFSIKSSTAHKRMFLSCMSCLMTVGIRAKINSKESRVFFDYAASSWPTHMTASSPNDEEVFETLEKFLTGRWILTWIQFLASTNKLRVLVETSRHITKYLHNRKSCHDNSDQTHKTLKQGLAKSWAEDLAKIVGKFGIILNQDPESIYRLIPPFCPQNSAIYRQFGKLKDESLVVSGLQSNNWDDSLARLSFGLKTQATSILAVGAQVAALAPSGRVFLHDSATFESAVVSPLIHGERVYNMVLNSSAQLLATYGYHSIKVWNVHTGTCKFSINNPPSRPRPLAMTFSEDDQSILVGSDDRRIRRLDLSLETPTWQVLAEVEEKELEGHFLNSPNHMALEKKGRLISVAYRGHPLSAWEIDGPVHIGHCWRTREVLARGEVIEAFWHPHQFEVIGLYIEGVIFKWRPYDDEAEEFATGASRLAMSTDGSLLVTGDARGTIKLFTTAPFNLLYQLASEDSILGLAFSPDLRRFYDIRGNYANAWEPNALLKFVDQQNRDAESGNEIRSVAQISSHSENTYWRVDAITSLAVSLNGRLYCSGSEKGAVHLYERQRGKLATIYRSRSSLSIEKMAWSHDGRCLSFSDSSKRVFFVEVHEPVKEIEVIIDEKTIQVVKVALDGAITQLLYHPDSTQTLVCTQSSACVIALASALVVASSKMGTLGSQWTCHPGDSTLLICIGPNEIQIFDWSLNLRNVFGMDHLTYHTELSNPPGQANVAQVLPTANGDHLLVQIEYRSGRTFLLLETAPLSRASEWDDRAGATTLSGTVTPKELDHSTSSQIIFALELISSNHLIFLSRDFAICSMQIQAHRESIQPSSSIVAQADQTIVLSTEDKKISALPETVEIRTNGLGKVKALFWLPRDWISRDCLALCRIWRKERSLLCPRNGEIAVVRCTSIYS